MAEAMHCEGDYFDELAVSIVTEAPQAIALPEKSKESRERQAK